MTLEVEWRARSSPEALEIRFRGWIRLWFIVANFRRVEGKEFRGGTGGGW